MQESKEHELGSDWETAEDATISLDMKPPPSHFPFIPLLGKATDISVSAVLSSKSSIGPLIEQYVVLFT